MFSTLFCDTLLPLALEVRLKMFFFTFLGLYSRSPSLSSIITSLRLISEIRRGFFSSSCANLTAILMLVSHFCAVQRYLQAYISLLGC